VDIQFFNTIKQIGKFICAGCAGSSDRQYSGSHNY
jgi:hypothetical protein